MTKLVSLHDAVARTVSPGAMVLFAFTHNRSHAAVFEVARQFRDRRCLHLVATGLLEYASILVAAGAVALLESAFAGGTYPAPAPSRILQQEIDASCANDPNWTNLTMTLRLMAGAMGWPFVPTHSLAASDLWSDRGRAQLASPFSDESVTVVSALQPDVTFVHVPVADTSGNAIVHGPDAEESWGVWAAKRVVVTAERVVSPDELRRIGPRAGIAGHRVDFVVETPFGAHPQGQFVWSDAEGVASYAEDYEFRRTLRTLTRDPDALRSWVEDWVFKTDPSTYLERLGSERLEGLRQQAVAPTPAAPRDADAPASSEERAAILAMRLAVSEAQAGRAQTFFSGIGLAHLAAWAAERRCRDAGIDVSLIAETGMVGFRPIEGDPYLFNRPNAASSLFHNSFVQTLAVLAGPRARNCLVMLAAAQIDARGNINSSRSSDGGFIVGSGGANDLGNGSAACLVVMPLKKHRFVEALPFTTTSIRHHAGVATDLGVLERDAQGFLRVRGVMCEPGAEDATLAQINACCGHALAVHPALERFDPPTAQELASLRRFDPQRAILA